VTVDARGIARWSLGVLVLAAFAAPQARAQSISPLDPPDTTRYLRWGPLRVRPGLTIPNFGYDSNVFYRPDESTQPRVGDYFIAVAPRVDGLVLFGHSAFLTFDERIEYYAYASETELNYFNQFGSARLTVPFRRFGIYGDIGYYRTRDRPLEAQDARPIRKELPVGAGLIVKFGWRTDAEFGLTRNRLTASDEDDVTIGPRNDRVEKGLRLSARYLAFGRTRVLLDTSRRTIRFEDDLAAELRDGSERRALVGLDFGLGGRIYGTVRAGWSSFDLKLPGATEFLGMVANVALGYSFGGSGSRLTLTGSRDVNYSIYESTNLYTTTGGSLTLIKYFNRFLGGELGAGRSRLAFLGDPQDRVDGYTTGTIGVRFRISENDLGRRVEYAFRYVRSIVNSTQDNLDQNRGTIGFGVSFGY